MKGHDFCSLMMMGDNFNRLITKTPDEITSIYSQRDRNWDKFIEVGLTREQWNALDWKKQTLLHKNSRLFNRLVNDGFSPSHLYRLLDMDDVMNFTEYLSLEEDTEPFTSLRKLDEDEFPLLGSALKELGAQLNRRSAVFSNLFFLLFEVCRCPKPLRQIIFQNILKMDHWNANVCPLPDFRNSDPDVVKALVDTPSEVVFLLNRSLPLRVLLYFQKDYVRRILDKAISYSDRSQYPQLPHYETVPNLEEQEKIVNLFEGKVAVEAPAEDNKCTIL
jgi:hypothetical protein